MRNTLLSIILTLAPLCQVRGQILGPILASPAVASGGSGPTLIAANCGGLGVNGGTGSDFDAHLANFLVVTMNFYNGVTALPTVTENNGNGAPTGFTAYNASGNSTKFYVWTNPTLSATEHIIVSQTSGSDSYCYQAWSGMATSGVVDSGTDSGASPNGTTCSPGSITPSSGKKVVVTSVLSNVSGIGYSINSSYTVVGTVQYSVGAYYGASTAYLIQTPDGATTNPQWTVPGGAVCGILAFKAQ